MGGLFVWVRLFQFVFSVVGGEGGGVIRSCLVVFGDFKNENPT